MRSTLLLCSLIVVYLSSALSQLTTEKLLADGFGKYAEGKYDEAIQTLLQADSTHPSAKLLFYLGSSYAALNDYPNAINAFQKSVRLEPNNSGYRYQLARMFAQSGLANDAAREYLAIIQPDSSYLPAFFQLGLIYTDRRHFREALQLNQYIINKNSKDFLAYYQATSSYVSLGESDSARMAIDSCLSINHKYIPALNLSASLHFSKKNYREARQQYLFASELCPEKADFIFKVGLCEAKLDSHTSAIASFKKAIALGQAYYKAGFVDSSLTAYLKAVEIDKDNPIVFMNIAIAWTHLDSLQNAIAAYNRSINAYHPEKIADIYYRIGSLLYGRNKFREAIAAFRKAVELQPTNSSAQFFIGMAYHAINDPKTAARQLEKYLNLASDDTTQRDRSRWVRDMLQQMKNKN